jgi:hypothetical protein
MERSHNVVTELQTLPHMNADCSLVTSQKSGLRLRVRDVADSVADARDMQSTATAALQCKRLLRRARVMHDMRVDMWGSQLASVP